MVAYFITSKIASENKPLRKIHFIVQSLMALMLLGASLDARSGVPAGYQAYPTDAELSSLPAFCKVKLRHHFDTPEYKSLQASLGPDFEHVHHYCAGLNFNNRYYRSIDIDDKKFYLQSALGEFAYMTSHAKPEFSLMPEIYLNQAITYSLMKNMGNAIASLEKAISLNPRLTRAYIMLADYEIELKMGSKALSTVTEGLRQTPNSKPLQKRYVSLGGKLPFPEPYQKPEEQESIAAEKGVAKEADIPDATHDQAQSGEPSTQGGSGATPTVDEVPAIGMPGNPWCRFCPDVLDAKGQKAGQTPAKP